MAQVRVRLQTARVQLIFEGDESIFERQIEPLLLRLASGGGPGRTAAQPTAAQPTAAPAADEPDIAEAPARDVWQPTATSFGTFQRQLAGEPDGTDSRIAAYAFYLWNYEKRETFGTKEIGGCFAADGATAPDDLAGSCSALEARRILQPAAHEGTWRLTPKGTNQVRKLLR